MVCYINSTQGKHAHIGIEHVACEAIDDSIVLFDLAANKTIAITVPHSDASAYHALVRLQPLVQTGC